MLTAIVILNNNGGSMNEEAAEAALKVLRGSFEIVDASSVEDLAASTANVVIVMGGDGTLHTTVRELNRLDRLDKVTLGLIPLGTGNDFARTLGVPDDPAQAAQIVTNGHRIDIDLLCDDAGGVVVNAVHLGAGAEAAERAETWKESIGSIGYAVGALAAGINDQPLDVQVSVDGTALPAGNGMLQVAINNGKYVGGGTPLSPNADPTDGVMDVLVSYATSATERLSYANDLRKGTHIERDDTMTARGTTVTVHGGPFTCSADGEIENDINHRTWTMKPAALTMFVPDAAMKAE